MLESQYAGYFAGAGVSMDPPSNYPDFNALASRIGGVFIRGKKVRQSIVISVNWLESV